MKPLIFLLGLCLQAQSLIFPGPGNKGGGGASAITLLVSTSAASANSTSVTTSAIDTTGATGIVIVTTQSITPAFVISDNKSNTWASVSTNGATSMQKTGMYRCVLPCTVGTGHTFTNNPGASGLPAIAVMAFSNTNATTFFDTPNQSSAQGSTTSNAQAGSVTCSLNNCLYVAAVSYNDNLNTTVNINSSFNTPVGTNQVAAMAFSNYMSYFIQGTASALNPTWTKGTGTNVAVVALLAAFRP